MTDNTHPNINKQAVPPIHQWTHDGDRVLIVKCLNRDGTSHDGFGPWPKSGMVECPDWNPEPEFGGGLHGWAWGMGGDGRCPDACAPWIVIAADPADVVDLGDKVKCRRGKIVYYGEQAGAMHYTSAGRIAWIEARSHGSASATCGGGSASATSTCGSASATGYCGSASATGYLGSASATSTCGSASATGYCGSAGAIGDSGSAGATGSCGSASATGDNGSASATGYCGSASATGYSGLAGATGYSGAASATGSHGSAIATGYCGSASATGDSGLAGATGYGGSASATGKRSIAAATRNDSTIEVASTGIAACTADTCNWIVRRGAFLIQRWRDESGDTQTVILDSIALDLRDGEEVRVDCGVITRADDDGTSN